MYASVEVPLTATEPLDRRQNFAKQQSGPQNNLFVQQDFPAASFIAAPSTSSTAVQAHVLTYHVSA